MDETMRRSDRKLTDEETLRLFHEAEYGVLSLIDENNVPYGIPMSFALCDNVIYFHCSVAGGKRISGIRHDPNACFTVIEHTKLLPQQFATLYMSGIAYGTIKIVADETEKRKGIEAILHKYSTDYIEKGMKYIDATLDKIYVLRFEIEKMTGKGRKAYCCLAMKQIKNLSNCSLGSVQNCNRMTERKVWFMNTLEAITTRRSVRRFLGKPVENEQIEAVVTAASFAPSWKNTQTARYIAITDPVAKETIAAEMLPSSNAATARSAPVLIAMVTQTGRCGYERDGSYTTKKKDRWQYFDAGIACQTFCLAAHEMGLATVIMGIYNEEKLPAFLGVAEDQVLTAIIALGNAADIPACPKRKGVEELLRYI